jgi:SulP family sulfate permease
MTVRRFVPILSWLPHYERGWFSGDMVAGFTIWGLLIPEMIAYASLAGLPPQAGLSTARSPSGRAGNLPAAGPSSRSSRP